MLVPFERSQPRDWEGFGVQITRVRRGGRVESLLSKVKGLGVIGAYNFVFDGGDALESG